MSRSLAGTIRAANRTLIEEGDGEAVERFFTADHVTHVAGRTMKGGHDGVRQYLALVRRAFPKIQVEVDVLVEDGDRAAWQRTLRGVQEGAFRGFPATGREVVWRDMVVSRVRDGLIAEEWVVTDLAEQLLSARKK